MLEDKTKLQNLAFVPFENLFSVQIVEGTKNEQGDVLQNTTKLQNLAFDPIDNCFNVKIIGDNLMTVENGDPVMETVIIKEKFCEVADISIVDLD